MSSAPVSGAIFRSSMYFASSNTRSVMARYGGYGAVSMRPVPSLSCVGDVGGQQRAPGWKPLLTYHWYHLSAPLVV